MSETGPGVLRGFVGGLLFAVGLLISLLSGACTLAIWSTVLTLRDGANVLAIGGGPFAAGVVWMVLGWRMMFPHRRKRPRMDIFSDPPPPA